MGLLPARRHSNGLMKNLLASRREWEGRQEKIASLSKAVKSNTYRLDCRKLADCLIAGLLLGLLR